MTRTKAAFITAALAAGTLTLWPADDLPCDPGSIYMQTVAVRDGDTCTVETVALHCGDDGQPSDTAFTVEPESQPIDCASVEWTADVVPYPLEQRYPECLVGEVIRDGLVSDLDPSGEGNAGRIGTWTGACCQVGCRCQDGGTCEHIAPGGPQWYERTRLCRLLPDAPDCPQPE